MSSVEEQVFAHARDPYKRVDILPSSRYIRVVLGGVTIADCYYSHFFALDWTDIGAVKSFSHAQNQRGKSRVF